MTSEISTTQHTPGPWGVSTGDQITVTDSAGGLIATVSTDDIYHALRSGRY